MEEEMTEKKLPEFARRLGGSLARFEQEKRRQGEGEASATMTGVLSTDGGEEMMERIRVRGIFI